MSSENGGPTRNMAPLLAAFFTVLYALVPIVILVAAASDNPFGDWSLIIGGVAAVAGVAIIGRWVGQSSLADGLYLAFRERRDDPLAGYEVRKKSRRRKSAFGSIQPPTAHDIREIREAAATTTWLPRDGKRS